MDNYVFAVCTSGHVIDADEASMVSISELDTSEIATEGILENPDYSVKQNYCPDCGSKILTECPECSNTIQAEVAYNQVPDESSIPDFCFVCGEDFPWIETIRAEKQREKDFLDINDETVNGHFYPELIYEINLCYGVKADQAVLVLNRKLIENLIVDILRAAFGMDEMELFYDREIEQIHPLSVLLQNMKDRRVELRKYGSLDEDFFRALEEMKYRGDASAHSIEESVAQTDLSAKSEAATDVVRTLFRLRNEVKTAHRKS